MTEKNKAGKFTGEIWLSTDGKHTVHVIADTPDGRKAGGEWAVKAYQWIVEQLGTKPKMWADVMNGKQEREKETRHKSYAEKEIQENCPHPTFKILQVKKEGPNQRKYYKKCSQCGKFLGWVKV